jgi:RND family efflux transporter MFP subunit
MNPAKPDSSGRRRLFFHRVLTDRQKLAIWCLTVPVVLTGAFFTRQELAAMAESRKPAAVEPLPIAVKTIRVAPETIRRAIRYSGTVKEWQRVELSFRVAGTIGELRRVEHPDGGDRDLHEGDRFPKGTVLARLDPADYLRDRAVSAEKLAQAEAKLISARADAENAEREYARQRSGFDKGVVASTDLDSAKAKAQSTAATVTSNDREVQSARVQLAQADANLSYCTLVMPYPEGTVATRYVEANERVSVGQKAFQILDLSSVRIAFGVSDAVVGRLAIGGVVTVTSDALPEERFRGVITKIAPTADSQTRTYLIEVRIAAPKGLRPGMVATASLGEDKVATLVPLVAVTREASGGQLVVYKVVREGDRAIARACPVELEGVIDNRAAVRVVTPKGIRPGDEIVVAGAPRLFDGSAIQSIGEPTAANTESKP